MHARTWRWLRTRVIGLLYVSPAFHPDGRLVPATRLGFALDPPSPPKQPEVR